MKSSIVSGIYRITNTANGEIYIGSSVDVDVRWKGHRYHLQQGKHHSVKMQADWNRHGDEAFVYEILELVSEYNTLLKREAEVIAELKPGYNTLRNPRTPRKEYVPRSKGMNTTRERDRATVLALIPEYVTPEYIAQQISTTEQEVLLMIRRGELPATQFGKQYRVKVSDLEEYIKQHSNRPENEQEK